jgi:hypothetical protein
MSPETFALHKATNFISIIDGFSDSQRVELYRYFSHSIMEAGSLPEHNPSYLAAIL